jgi:DNA-binding transcriptional ArsR family regulator
MGTMARPAYRDKKPSDKILQLLPGDGVLIPLAVLRTSLMKAHMSPSTLSKELKALADVRLVERIIDPTRPPRVYYRRRPRIPSGPVQYDKWLQMHLNFIEGVLRMALSEIVANPRIELEKTRSRMDFVMSRRYWMIVSDFQKLLQSKRISGIERLEGYVFDGPPAAWAEKLGEPFEMNISFELLDEKNRPLAKYDRYSTQRPCVKRPRKIRSSPGTIDTRDQK